MLNSFNIDVPTNESISHATLNPRDLIPAFLDALREYHPSAYAQFLLTPFGPVPSYVVEDPDSDWWYSEEASWLMEDLFDALGDAAPDGYYFGAHPGDGSDFGFWGCEDEF